MLYYWIVSLLAFSESALSDFFFFQGTWSLHRLGTDVPLITCLVDGFFTILLDCIVLAFSESGLLDFSFSQSSWSLHRLATDVPLITCLVNGVFYYIIGLYRYWLSLSLDCQIFLSSGALGHYID